MNEALSDDLFQFWNNLLKTFQEQKLPRTRVTAMVCLNRLLGHIGNTDQLDLSKSVLKQWCLQSLKSSVRDLRIASV